MTTAVVTGPAPPARSAATSGVTAAVATTIRAAGIPHWSTDRDIGVRRVGTADLPPAEITAVMLSRALVEVLAGRRAPSQLSVHCAPDVFAGLLQHAPRVAHCLPRLLTVRVCEPADGIAEVCAAFRRAERVRAIAFRLEGLDGRWCITVLQLG